MTETRKILLSQLTPAEAAAWAIENRGSFMTAHKTHPLQLLIQAGFDELDVIAELVENHRTLDQFFSALTELIPLLGDGPWWPWPSAITKYLEAVGPRVLVHDRHLVDAWLEVSAGIARHHGNISRQARPAWRVIDDMYAAGLSCGEAARLVDAAIDGGVEVDAFGFDRSKITPNLIRGLGRTGIKSMAELELLHRAGLTTEEAVKLVSSGVGPEVLTCAVESGLTLDECRVQLVGIPARWVTSEALHEKASWAELSFLAQNGWADLARHLGSDWSRKGGELTGVTVQSALTCARVGLTLKQTIAWAKALGSGKATDYGIDGLTLPPLVGYGRRGVTASDVARYAEPLLAKGVKAAHLDEFRNCGARSVDDVHRLVDAGVGYERARALRGRLPKTNRRGSSRFATVDECIRAHREDAAA